MRRSAAAAAVAARMKASAESQRTLAVTTAHIEHPTGKTSW